MNKYAVIYDLDDEQHVDYFPTEDEAVEFVRSLMRKAEAEVADLEGHLPNWITDVWLTKLVIEVQDSPEGLVMKREAAQ